MQFAARCTSIGGVVAAAVLAAAACGAPGDRAQSASAGTANAATPPAAATAGSAPAQRRCAGDNGGITLPPGFCATVFADSLGRARHLVVAPSGVVYVNTWQRGRTPAGPQRATAGFLVALQDTTGDGRADVVARFGARPDAGGRGGTGIALHNGALYAEERTRIVRYPLPAGALTPRGAPVAVVSGLPITGDHPTHPFVIGSDGSLYVNLGSASNSCQRENRTLESPGLRPCTELETRAGVWRYDARRTAQPFSPRERFATGIRNAVGLAFAPDGSLYATQHGRDQLAENWPRLYRPEAGANEPAEELLQVGRGTDAGWPFCYFDSRTQRLVLAPEYGGDGGRAVGRCASKQAPVATFPAHWAPNDLLFYTGSQFPGRYRGGAFIAFHGSWNRAPFPQAGYNVSFVPFGNGRPSGRYEVFADGFAGGVKQPDRAAHRPAGLAQGPDGALYVADDKGGRIWRITYTAAPAAAPGNTPPAQR